MDMTSAFTLNVRLDHIAVVTIDVPGEKMNTLKAEFAAQVRAILKEIRENKEIRGVVFISAKADNFIAGADINMIDHCNTAMEAETLARQGQQLMAEIHALPVPVIAAIHGACLGGGLELALACHGRICTDDPKTILGLPEVQLGLLPGSGGTQRLPRLVGLSTALDMILTGKQLRPGQALKSGLVDEIVPNPFYCRRLWNARNRKGKHRVLYLYGSVFLPGRSGVRFCFALSVKKQTRKHRVIILLPLAFSTSSKQVCHKVAVADMTQKPEHLVSWR